MARSITVEAVDEEITDAEVEGMMGLIAGLHDSVDLSRVRVELEAESGVLEQLTRLDTGEPLEEGRWEIDEDEDKYASEDEQDEAVEEDVDEGETDDGEEEIDQPTISEYDDPEAAGEAWMEYYETTGNVPRLNPDSKYYTVITFLRDASEPLTTAEIVARSEDAEQELTQSQASSHLYSLLQKGVVEREKPNGSYEYILTELGSEAIQQAEEQE